MELSWQAAAEKLDKTHRTKNAKSRLCQSGSVGGDEAFDRLSVDASSRVGQRRNIRGDAFDGGGDAAERPKTEDNTARRRRQRTASLRDLAPADKKRVANLIQELARLGQEKERITAELQSEREQFERTKQQLAGEQQRLLAERQSVQLELAQCQAMLLRFQQEVVNKLERAATASSAAPVAAAATGRTAIGVERPSSVAHASDDYMRSAPVRSSSALSEASSPPPPSSIASDDGCGDSTNDRRARGRRTFQASEPSGTHESSGYLSRTLDDYIDHFDRAHDGSRGAGSRSESLLRPRPSSAVHRSVAAAHRQPDEPRNKKHQKSSAPADTSASCRDCRTVTAAAAAPHVTPASDAAAAAAAYRVASERSHFSTKVVRAPVESESRTARVTVATGYAGDPGELPFSPKAHCSAGWLAGDDYCEGLYHRGRRFYGDDEEADDSAVVVNDHSRSLVTDGPTRWPHRVVAEPCEHPPSVAYVPDASLHVRTPRCTLASGAVAATRAQLYTSADVHSAAQHASGDLHSDYSREFSDRRREERQPLYLSVAEPRAICSHGFCRCAHSGYFVGVDRHGSYPAPEFRHHRTRGTQETTRRSPSKPSGLLSTSVHREQQQPSYARSVEQPASSAEPNRSCSRGASFVPKEPVPLEAEHRSVSLSMSLNGGVAGQLRPLSAKPSKEKEEPALALGQSLADDADVTESRLLEDVFFVK